MSQGFLPRFTPEIPHWMFLCGTLYRFCGLVLHDHHSLCWSAAGSWISYKYSGIENDSAPSWLKNCRMGYNLPLRIWKLLHLTESDPKVIGQLSFAVWMSKGMGLGGLVMILVCIWWRVGIRLAVNTTTTTLLILFTLILLIQEHFVVTTAGTWFSAGNSGVVSSGWSVKSW